MMRTLLLTSMLLAGIQQQSAPSPPAPPPGSPGTFRAGAALMAALEKATASAAGMSTSAVSNTDQYRIKIGRAHV